MAEEREEIFRPFPGSDADVFIQWKGTKVCMDFRCPCGAHLHFDQDFLYFVQCFHCSATYEMGTQVLVRKIDPEKANDPKVGYDDEKMQVIDPNWQPQ